MSSNADPPDDESRSPPALAAGLVRRLTQPGVVDVEAPRQRYESAVGLAARHVGLAQALLSRSAPSGGGSKDGQLLLARATRGGVSGEHGEGGGEQSGDAGPRDTAQPGAGAAGDSAVAQRLHHRLLAPGVVDVRAPLRTLAQVAEGMAQRTALHDRLSARSSWMAPAGGSDPQGTGLLPVARAGIGEAPSPTRSEPVLARKASPSAEAAGESQRAVTSQRSPSAPEVPLLTAAGRIERHAAPVVQRSTSGSRAVPEIVAPSADSSPPAALGMTHAVPGVVQVSPSRDAGLTIARKADSKSERLPSAVPGPSRDQPSGAPMTAPAASISSSAAGVIARATESSAAPGEQASPSLALHAQARPAAGGLVHSEGTGVQSAPGTEVTGPRVQRAAAAPVAGGAAPAALARASAVQLSPSGDTGLTIARKADSQSERMPSTVPGPSRDQPSGAPVTAPAASISSGAAGVIARATESSAAPGEQATPSLALHAQARPAAGGLVHSEGTGVQSAPGAEVTGPRVQRAATAPVTGVAAPPALARASAVPVAVQLSPSGDTGLAIARKADSKSERVPGVVPGPSKDQYSGALVTAPAAPISSSAAGVIARATESSVAPGEQATPSLALHAQARPAAGGLVHSEGTGVQSAPGAEVTGPRVQRAATAPVAGGAAPAALARASAVQLSPSGDTGLTIARKADSKSERMPGTVPGPSKDQPSGAPVTAPAVPVESTAPDMVWRAADRAPASAGLARTAISGRPDMLARSPADGVGASNSRPADPAAAPSGIAQGGTISSGSNPAPSEQAAPDLERLAEQVTRIIARRLEVERERRGGRKW